MPRSQTTRPTSCTLASRRHLTAWLTRTSVLVSMLLTSGAAIAAPGTWQTDTDVGPSQVSYRLTFTCTGPVAVCDALNGYDDTQISTLSDGATLQIDDVLETLQFDIDGNVDLDDGMGPVPTSPSLAGSDMVFAGIALFGVPEVVNPVVFSGDQPLVALPGLTLQTPGVHPISTQMNWGGIADVIGTLSGILPKIVVSPASVPVTGTLEVLGDTDSNGFVEYEIQGLQATAQSTDQYTEPGSGLVVDIHVTADLLLNLSGEAPAPSAPVPVLSAAGVLGLVGLLGGVSTAVLRRRARA